MITILAKNLSGAWVYEPRLARAQHIKTTTQYPGGLYGALTFMVPHTARDLLAIRDGFEILAYYGLEACFVGVVTDLETVSGKETGTRVTVIGHWGALLGVRTLYKNWADTRLDQERWVWNETATGAEKCLLDRYNRLRFTPKAEGWTNGQNAAVYYTMPLGQTIKRITFTYDFQEAAQAWELQLYNTTGAATEWSVTASGTGSQDITLATPSRSVRFRFYARANQTPPSDGTIYGELTDPVVYSETGSINLTEVTKDIRAALSALSTNEHLIGSNTFTLEPFVTANQEKVSHILDRAAGYGDSSQWPWAVGVRGPRLASDEKPVLFAEAQPDLATVTPHYELSLAGREFAVRRNASEVWNWIVVQYRDSRGFTQVITPDDDSTLTDAASVATHGRREMVLDVNSGGVSVATNYARRFLAKWKEPSYALTSPVQVTGMLRSARGGLVPAALIQAGQVARMTDFLPDLRGTGLTLLITATNYDHDTRTCRLAFGVPERVGR